MDMQRYSIRLERSHSEAFELWWEFMRDLRWNRWSDDLATYLKASRTNAILLGDLDGTTIGHVLAAIYGNKTGWVGLFVVQSQYRGRLFGRSLLDAAMDQFRIHATAYVGLDSVAEQKSSYERRGFVASPLGKIRSMSYKLSPSSSLVTISGLDSNLSELHLVDLREIPCEILSQSDYDHTGFERSDLWGIGIQNRADFFGLALAKKGKAFDKESVHGWVAIRRASEGYRLGPVYAADAAASRTLIRAAIQATARQKYGAEIHMLKMKVDWLIEGYCLLSCHHQKETPKYECT
ncbi:hypothetical protein KCU89_g31, partial [Aureobasidium melanogenum]